MAEVKKRTKAEKENDVEVKTDSVKHADEPVKFKGKYIKTVGKRKSATATIRLYKSGTGNVIVNGDKMSNYFSTDLTTIALLSLKLSGLAKDFDVSAKVMGGGKSGQANAIRLGISRALIEFNKELRPSLKAKGFLTRDPREKERKKPGLKRARKAPQWSKR